MAPTWNQRLRGIIGSQLGADIVEQNIEKAVESAQRMAKTSAQPMTQFYNPYTMFFGREWLVKSGTQLQYSDLRMMAKNPIIGSIIHTRLNQVAAFCHPSNGDYEAGYDIKMGNEKNLNSDQSKVKEYISNFMVSAGMEGYGDLSLEEFARKFIRDSLILDQGCAEVVNRQNKLPAYLVAADGATIRRLNRSLEFNPDRSKPIYAQVMDEVIVAEYTQDQMIFGIRNPSTDVLLNGYGSSELELLINVVTIMANAEKYNASALAQGGTQKGILVVKGQVDGTQLDMFKRDFREAVANAASTWRPPVLGIGPDASVDWVTLDRSNKDMEYAQLFEFIIKLATGVYQISPEEVNWQVGQSGASVTYNSGVKDRLSYSQDKGLRPLLNFFSGHLNTSVVRKLDPSYTLTFTGLGTSKRDEADIRKKEVESYKTLNEVRADASLPPIPGGDIVLNPAFLNANSAARDAPADIAKDKGGQDQEYSFDPEEFDMEKSVSIDWSH